MVSLVNGLRQELQWGGAGKAGLSGLESLGRRQGAAGPPATAMAPGAALRIPPGAIPRMRDILPVRSAATFATALGPRQVDDL